MNRSALCIKMLMMLKARGKMNTKELAEQLETNPRNIREFKKELVTAGYNIQETKGRYGGYYLDEDCLFPSLNLTKDEIYALKESKGFIESHAEFESIKDFRTGLDKVLCADKDTKQLSRYYLNETSLSLTKKEKEMMNICQNAIEENLCVELTYQTFKEDKSSSFLVDPYEIIHFRNAYYVLGFSHRRNDYRMYRFGEQRMKDLSLTERKFLKDTNFQIASFIGKESLIKGDFIKFEILVNKDHIRMFNEQYWGLDYKQEEVADGFICSFICEDKNNLYKQLFTFKNYVKILSPSKCKEEYASIIKDILHMYYK